MFANLTGKNKSGKEEIHDKEAAEYFQQIVELLLTGGYFRARITGLSNFDKILGGLAWAISSSNVDVDIDVFQDTDTLAQKLKLGEGVVRSLVKMKCPYPLQTYQIKGLDYKSIFPVIQWLVKKVIETRAETGDLARQYSEYIYKKSDYAYDEAGGARATALEARLRRAQDRFSESLRQKARHPRAYRRQRGTAPTPQRTVLEYSYMKRRPEDERRAEAEKRRRREAEEAADVTDDVGDDEEEYLNDMAEVDSAGSKVAGSVVGSYMHTDQIKEAEKMYGGEKSSKNKKGKQTDEIEEEEEVAGGAQFEERMLGQKIANAGREIERAKAALEVQKKAHAERSEEIAILERRLAKKVHLNERTQQEIGRLEALETPENAAVLSELRRLIALNEALKGQLGAFRGNCKAHKTRLEEEIERRKKSMYGVSDLERIDLINETYDADSARLTKIRQLWAKKTREMSLVERKIDDVPQRAELAQYQRMFVELYDQVETKLVETRRYYCVYNRLEDTRQCIAKEVEFLESITANYEVAMRAKATKERLLLSMQNIVKQIQANYESKAAVLAREKQRHVDLSDKFHKMVEAERAYSLATKTFQDECKKNALLEDRLATIEAGGDPASSDEI